MAKFVTVKILKGTVTGAPSMKRFGKDDECIIQESHFTSSPTKFQKIGDATQEEFDACWAKPVKAGAVKEEAKKEEKPVAKQPVKPAVARKQK